MSPAVNLSQVRVVPLVPTLGVPIVPMMAASVLALLGLLAGYLLIGVIAALALLWVWRLHHQRTSGPQLHSCAGNLDVAIVGSEVAMLEGIIEDAQRANRRLVIEYPASTHGRRTRDAMATLASWALVESEAVVGDELQVTLGQPETPIKQITRASSCELERAMQHLVRRGWCPDGDLVISRRFLMGSTYSQRMILAASSTGPAHTSHAGRDDSSR